MFHCPLCCCIYLLFLKAMSNNQEQVLKKNNTEHFTLSLSPSVDYVPPSEALLRNGGQSETNK